MTIDKNELLDIMVDRLLEILILGGGTFTGWILVFLAASAMMEPIK